jgi:hypothetical protein
MSIVNPFVMKPHRWGRLSDHYAETLPEILLFETLLLHHIESLFKVVCRYSTSLPTLKQGEGTRDSCVAIDHLQWPLLGRYLFEVYLTPGSLDSPCAPHALLAIK